jgi:RHS repeat-associated protein
MLLATNSLQPSAYYPSYDANGNVTDLTDTNGTSVAHYEYDPYGNTTPASFSTVANPFQFSTKYFDAETGLNYYGYRYYSPNLGRWISRDPSEEQGGLNVYSFVGNEAIGHQDDLGLDCICISDRNVILGQRHYILEKLQGCCPNEGEEKHYQDWVPSKLTNQAKVELLRIVSFRVEHYNSFWHHWFNRDLSLSSGISAIHYNYHLQDDGTKNFKNVYDSSHGDMETKWDEIIDSAKNYGYAEQGLYGGDIISPEQLLTRMTTYSDVFGNKFPKSIYNAFGNNSNVFARNMLKKAGIPVLELSGAHPPSGQSEPTDTSDDFDATHYRNLRVLH